MCVCVFRTGCVTTVVFTVKIVNRRPAIVDVQRHLFSIRAVQVAHNDRLMRQAVVVFVKIRDAQEKSRVQDGRILRLRQTNAQGSATIDTSHDSFVAEGDAADRLGNAQKQPTHISGHNGPLREDDDY